MPVNEKSIRDFAAQATLKAIEFGKIASVPKGDDCAKNVVEFYNTIVDELTGKYLPKSE